MACDVKVQQLIDFYLAMRADGLSIVKTAEKGLEALGRPVETAIRTRRDRRKAHHRPERTGAQT